MQNARLHSSYLRQKDIKQGKQNNKEIDLKEQAHLIQLTVQQTPNSSIYPLNPEMADMER
jgi:hypothetical protein